MLDEHSRSAFAASFMIGIMRRTACRMVAALLGAGNVAACRVPVGLLSDLEFAHALACRELELIVARR